MFDKENIYSYLEVNYSDTRLLYFKHSKFQTKRFYHGSVLPKDANIIANSEDTDQTARP